MFDDVRRYLSDTIDAFATKRYDDLQQITEFAPAAKAMRISRIVRTLNYGGRVSETLVYKDTEIFPLYNKNTIVKTQAVVIPTSSTPMLILQH